MVGISGRNPCVPKPGFTLEILIERDGDELLLPLTPQAVMTEQGTIGQVGAYARIPEDLPQNNRIMMRYGVFEALIQGTIKTWDMSWFHFAHARAYVDWAGVFGQYQRADYHCPVCRRIGYDGFDDIPDVYGAGQYQFGGAQFIARSGIGWRTSSVLFD